MHLVILTRQIGHYHDARYRGAAAVIPRLTVISTANQGGFAEFLAKDTGAYAVCRLFADRAAYDAAVRDHALRSALENVLSELLPDVIAISGWSNPESLIAIRWARQHGVRLIMMSETQADDAKRSQLRELAKARIVQACHAALVGGHTHAAYVAQLGIPVCRTHLGYNAVDNDHFAQGAHLARSEAATFRARLNLPERYMLASCRFIPKKNLPTLVRAYADVARSAAADLPELVILGDGEEREKILSAAQQGGVGDRVHLPGFRGYEVLPAYYGMAELFIHVSTVEQWGLVINEAMASGTPVLASDTCGATRTLIKDGHNGFSVAPTREGIAEGLKRFLTLDAGARERLAKAGAEEVEQWGPERFGAGMNKAVNSAMQCPPQGKLAPWDRALFTHMEGMIVETVS